MISTNPHNGSTGQGRFRGVRGQRLAVAGALVTLLLGMLAAIPLLRAAEGQPATPPGATVKRAPGSPAKVAGTEEHDAGDGHAEHAEHEGRDDHGNGEDAHDSEGEAGAKGGAGKGHEGHGHDDGEDSEAGLTLSADEKRNAGLAIATAGPGTLTTEISMPGEVSLNRDRVVHVVPQVPGIAREIHATEGDAVAAGQVLAVLDSSELAEAKLDYLTKANEVLRCDMLVPRAKAVHDSTRKLLDFLGTNPSLENLQTFEVGEAGANLTTLVGAYAELAQTRQAFEREQGLHRKDITSGQEYFAAKTAYEKAAAEYRAARDSVAFDTRRELLEAEATLRAARFAARTAEQRLRIMGISDADVHELDKLVLPEKACTDPTCTGCQPGASAEEREHYFGNGFAKYEVRAPIAGQVVERHLSRGEKVGDDADLFTLADTGTVWVDLTVYLKDLPALRVGDEVEIRAQHSSATARGRITVLLPTVAAETRTATARVAIENSSGEWRPGLFVSGRVRTSAERLGVVIPKHAVQTVDGRQVVFVPKGDRFEPVAVRTGRADRERVEIVEGLAEGAPFVSEGAFELKAKLVTSALGSHAGHGH